MKQLLSLFLFFLPCFVWAQYPSNGNQKITLGEQTTADGLIWRGMASIDTVTATSKITRANKQDTSAFLLLDTVTNLLWHYKTASNGWIQAGGGTSVTTFSGGTTGFTPNTATSGAVTLGGTLAVANGGTGASVRTFVDTINTQTVNGAKTFTSAVTATRFNPTANTATGTGMFAPTSTSLGFSTNGTNKMTLDNIGNLGLRTTPSNWVSTWSAFDFGAGGCVYSNGATNVAFTANGYNTDGGGGWLYKGTGNANLFQTSNGQFFWYNAISGTANNPITFNFLMNLDANGRLGIGDADPTQKLHVVGNARITAMNGIGDIGADANGVLQAAVSDMNLKNTIDNSPFGLNEILLLNPVTFLYNDTNRKIDNDVKDVGFIAQDVFDIIPNAVSATGTGDLQLDYRAITATLVKAIQEQQALIKALEQRIINLENK